MEYHIKKNILFKNEFYIAPLYNDLIKIGKKYIIDIANHFIPLGTPEEVARFEKVSGIILTAATADDTIVMFLDIYQQD